MAEHRVRSDWPELVTILNKGLAGFSESDAHNIIRKWSYLPADRKRLELTEEEQAWLAAHPKITLGGGIFAPLDFIDSEGQAAGLGPDYARLISSLLGIEFEYVSGDWAKIQEMARQKQIDGIRLLFKNEEREQYLNFSESYSTLQHAILTLKSSAEILSLQDLSGKRVGTMNAVYAQRYMQKHYPDIVLVAYPSVEDALQAVANGDVEAAVVSLAVAGAAMDRLFITSLKVSALAFELAEKLHLGIRKDWPEFTTIINKAIKAIPVEKHSEIKGRWVSHDYVDNKKQLELTPQERAWISAHPKVSIAYPGGYPPYSFQDQQGRFKGISVDYVNEIARRTGLKLKVYPDGNWENLYSAALQREVDVVGGIIRRPERDEWFAFTKPYLSTAQHIITRKDQSGIRHRNDIAGKTIALVKGYATTRSLLEEFPTVKPYYVDNVMAAFEAVSLGHADACLGVMGAAQYFIAEKGIQNLRFAVMFSEEITDWRISVRKDWPVLQAIFDKALASISDDERHKIFLRWTTLEVAQVEAVKSVKGTLKLTDLEQAWIAQKQPIRVRIVNFPPYTILGQGKPTGIVPDYLKRITEQTGVKFKLEETSSTYAEALRGLQNLEGPDVIPSMMFSPEERNVLFSNPYQASPVVFYTRTDADFITSISDLIGKRVIVNKGTVIEQALAREYPAVNLVYCRSAEQGLLRLAKGEADAFIGNLTATSFLIQKHGLTNVRVAAPSPFPEHQMSFGVRKDWPELIGIINKVLDGITVEERSAMQGKYLSVRYEHGIHPGDVLKWVGAVAGSAILIILLFVGSNRILRQKVKERTAEILEKESRFRRLVEQTPMAIEIHDLEGKIVQANPAFASMHNLEGEALNQILEHYNVRKDEQAEELGLQPYIERVYAGEDVLFPPYKYSTDEATKSVGHETAPHELWTQVRGFPLKNSEGQVVNAVFFAEDITEQRDAQALLEETEGRFRATFEQAAVGIAHVSPDGHFLRLNQKFCDIVGYSHDEMRALTFQEITHPDDLDADVAEVQRLLDGEGDTYSIDKRYIHKNGSLVWINLTVSLIRDDAAQPKWFVAVVKDITERKQAEDALKESEEKFRQLIEQAPMSIQVMDPGGRVTETNQAWMDLWGFSEEGRRDVLANYNMLEDEQARDLGVMPLIERAFRGEAVVLPAIEYDLASAMGAMGLKEEGGKIWIQVRLYPVKNSNDNVVSVVSIEENISERKEAEEKIRAHQERLRALAADLTLTEERERRRIATELHDGAAQSLAFARIQLSSALKSCDDEAAVAKLDDLSQLLKESLQQIRQVLLDLSSPALNEIGLSAALSEWLEEHVGRRHGLRVAFDDQSGKVPLTDDVRAVLFRNARELLMNAVKYAKATHISVSMTASDDTLRLVVQDDGVGFDPETVARTTDRGWRVRLVQCP